MRRVMAAARMLLWSIDATAGFDTAWASIDRGRLRAEGRACALIPFPYWVAYALATDEAYATSRMDVHARWADGSATVELRRNAGGWEVDGKARPDLDEALDCDLAACPLTNTMPILRHNLHRSPGDETFVMAFIEVPELRVIASTQRYTHLNMVDRGAVVRYRSDSFHSDVVVDGEGFVLQYPKLGRRVEPRSR